MTIDEAIDRLTKLREITGGSALLIPEDAEDEAPDIDFQEGVINLDGHTKPCVFVCPC